MLAKVITWGDDRQESIRKMIRALQDTVILGVTTNIPYLIDILENPLFKKGDISVNFLQENMEPWQVNPDTSNSTWLALAAYEALVDGIGKQGMAVNNVASENDDPWDSEEGWRNVA